MKELKQAKYLAHKYSRVANKMKHTQKMNQLKFYYEYEDKKAIFARIDGIGRAWKKAGRPEISTHLERVWKAELEIEKKRVLMLQEMVPLVVAKDSEMNKLAHIGLYSCTLEGVRRPPRA